MTDSKTKEIQCGVEEFYFCTYRFVLRFIEIGFSENIFKSDKDKWTLPKMKIIKG